MFYYLPVMSLQNFLPCSSMDAAGFNDCRSFNQFVTGTQHLCLHDVLILNEKRGSSFFLTTWEVINQGRAPTTVTCHSYVGRGL